MQTTNQTDISDNATMTPGSVTLAWKKISEWFRKRIAEPLRKRRLYRKTVEELSALDDRTLYDLGVARGQIHAIAYDLVYGSGERAIGRTGHAANDNRLGNKSGGPDKSDEPRLLRAA